MGQSRVSSTKQGLRRTVPGWQLEAGVRGVSSEWSTISQKCCLWLDVAPKGLLAQSQW